MPSAGRFFLVKCHSENILILFKDILTYMLLPHGVVSPHSYVFPRNAMFSMSFVLDVNLSFIFGFRTKPLKNFLLLRLSANVMNKALSLFGDNENVSKCFL